MRRAILLWFVVAAPFASSCSCDGGRLTPLHPHVSAAPASLAFDDTFVGASRSLRVTLASDGTAPVAIDAVAIDDDPSHAYAVSGGVPDALPRGSTFALAVSFAPTSAGPHDATLRIDSGSANNPHIVIALHGAGVAQPSCDDGNPCTDEHFDTDTAACIVTHHQGACDDGNACTANDRCSDGACIGDAVTCDDGLSCTRDLCDPISGCVAIPDDTVCVDSDPCSLDVCDPSAFFGSGCTHPAAPDGTPCGSFTSCVDIELCISQQCIDVAIPDGAPCSDGNLCTGPDTCTAQVCGGTPIVGPPTVVGETFRVAQPGLLLDDAVVFGGSSLNIVPLATLAPTGHLGAVAHGTALVADPLGARIASLQSAGSTGAESNTTHVVIIDVANEDAPLVIAEHDVGFASAVGADAERVFVCTWNPPSLLTVAWSDGALSTLSDDDGLCGPRQFAFDRHGTAVVVADDVLFDVDASGAHQVAALPVPPFDDPNQINEDLAFIDAGHVVITRAIFLPPTEVTQELFIGDVTDPANARIVAWSPPAPLGDPSRIRFDALQFPYAYISTALGPRRLDITNIDAPVIDAWSVSVPDDVDLCLADDQVVVFCPSFPFEPVTIPQNAVFVADASPGAHVAARVLGTGGITAPLLVGGDIVGADPQGLVPWRDTTLLDPVTESALDGPVFTSALVTNGVDAALFVQGLANGEAISAGTRADAATVVTNAAGASNTRPPVEIELGADGSTDVTAPLTLSLIDPVTYDTLAATSIEGCVGAGVATCIDGGCTPSLQTLTACDGEAGAITAFATVTVTHPDHIVSSVHHGSHISFLGTDDAVLLDMTNPADPPVIEVQVPELVDAAFASAAFADDTWLIVATYGDAVTPPRAVVFDTSSGSAVRRTAFDVGAAVGVNASGPRDEPRRALSVDAHEAIVSAWDPREDPQRGYSVVFYNLDVDPPVVTTALPINGGQPLRLVKRPVGLVVVRTDGITVIRPACGP